MAFLHVNYFLLFFALFFTANAYNLIFKNISLPDDSKDKFHCVLEAFKGNDENECGLGELQTDGRRNEELDWEDKLCLKVECQGSENETQLAFRLQQCELVNLKRKDKPLEKPIHLIDSNGCLAAKAKGQRPKLIPPLNYTFAANSVEMRGWTFDNETDSEQFPDEVTLSCEVQICADRCEQSCVDKTSLDKCSANDFITDKNATELCNGGSADAISFYLMTLLLFLSSTVLMFQ